MHLEKLLEHCERKNYPVEIVRNPDENPDELWQIRVYPYGWEGGNFFASYDNLERAAKKVMIEMEIL